MTCSNRNLKLTVEGLKAANQLASSQASQLMQIRSLLMAQQNAEVARRSALADIEAQQAAAATAQATAGTFKKVHHVSGKGENA